MKLQTLMGSLSARAGWFSRAWTAFWFFAATFVASAPLHAALTFDVDYSAGILASPKSAEIAAGISAATSTWSSTFRDSITVTVAVEFDSEAMDVDLGPSPFSFGTALSTYEEHLYTSVKLAMAGDAKSPGDSAALMTLQPGPFLEAITHDTSLSPAMLGPGIPSPEIRIGTAALGTTGPKAAAKWNSVLKVSRANSKALGLPVGLDPAYDIRLVLNDESVPVFDFERSDGVAPMMFDFQAIATHELGHGMGFVSGVDEVDFAGVGGAPLAPAPDNPKDLSGSAIFSVLDLFRTNLDTRPPMIPLGQPATGKVLDWRFGPPAGPSSKPFFTLDPGAIDPPMKTPFSTGTETGDGEQASHWADAPIGIMVPDLDPGILLDVTAADVMAFNVIGWDLVPEPTSAALLALGIVGLACRRQRPRRS